MATQSLYRRYRPRRFSELKGQDHIVKALRSSVAEGREGQAYLFSGPRGTGKTSSARILAKVLNCQNPAEGEPCCECESCVAVEKGTSYDVHELDAASNNGVDAMRDLIEKASLGTPGRHKVYILDEVHMLSKGAEAALLKTLEEPPPHVVFVLATTDPQKMSDTIRSRTQHLRFHLLGADTLHEHVRWVAEDAGLTVTDEAVEQVIAQGAGSPRDTLSALELVANTGGDAAEVMAVEEFVEAMIEHEPGRALTMLAQAINRGRDPRTVTEELIRFLREGFLSLMAPELVQLPSQRLEALTDVSRRLGPAGLVRGIEHLGQALTEMRQAPDPRVLLDVAIVQLTSEQLTDDVAGLAARLHKLERQVAAGAAVPAAGAAPAAAAPAPATPAPVDPDTGKRKLGSRVASASPTPAPAPAPDAAPTPAAEPPTAPVAEPAVAPESAPPAAASPAPAPAPAAPEPAPAAASASSGGGGAVSPDDWSAIRSKFKGMIRARFAPAQFVASAPGSLTIALPNAPHREKCEGLRAEVEAAVAEHVGSPVAVEMIVDGGGGNDGGGGSGGGGGGATLSEPSGAASVEAAPPAGVIGSPDMASTSGALAHDLAPTPGLPEAPADDPAARLSVVPDGADVTVPDGADVTEPVERPTIDAAASESADASPTTTTVANGRAIADEARARGAEPDPDAGLQTLADTLPNDEEVDLDELIDAPPESVKTPIDRLAEAFPGSELVDDTY